MFSGAQFNGSENFTCVQNTGASGSVYMTNCFAKAINTSQIGQAGKAYVNCVTGYPARFWGAGNSLNEPAYAIHTGSKAKDAGLLLDWMTGATDLGGRPRIVGTKPDIGCYENDGKALGTLMLLR